MPKQKPIYAFIDSQNLNLGVLDQGWKLDFKRFRVYLSAKYNVSEAFLFIGYIAKHKKMYRFLEQCGYKIIFKPVVNEKFTGLVKGNVDAELVLHTMINYKYYDKAVIVSGDGDFECLIKYLASNRKLEKVIVPNRKKYSRLLQKHHKHLVFLNNTRKKLELKINKKTGGVT